jgi:hypothetical protein
MADMQSQGRFDPARGPAHAPIETRIRPVVLFAIGLAALVLLALLGIRGFLQVLVTREHRLAALRPARFADSRGQYPGPALQPDPEQDLLALRRRESTRLHQYGWIDRRARVAHIPIDRAIDLVLERGLPTRAVGKRGGTE